MHYLYRITNQLNNKVYIGQTVDPNARWLKHKSYLKAPVQYIHNAMIKDGIDNFIFEVIASCRTQDDANEMEAMLIIQYNSRDPKFGYNIKPGGNTAPHSEETKRKLSKATKHQIQENGHPAQGTKRTLEQRKQLSEALKKREDYLTPEIRKRMSDSHKGQKPGFETLEKRKTSLKATNEAKIAVKIESGELKCNAPGCGKHGIGEWYVLYEGVRYCATHGARLKRNGSLELLPSKPPHNKGKRISEETRLKLLGRKPHNRHEFSDEQIRIIINDPRGAKRVAKDLGVTEKVIVRVRRENKK